VSYENTTSASAPLQSVSATYGFSLDEGKTQVMLSGHYADGSPLHLQDRLNLVQRGVTTILRNSPSYLYNVYSIFPGATPNISSLDPSTNLTLKDGTPLKFADHLDPGGRGRRIESVGRPSWKRRHLQSESPSQHGPLRSTKHDRFSAHRQIPDGHGASGVHLQLQRVRGVFDP